MGKITESRLESLKVHLESCAEISCALGNTASRTGVNEDIANFLFWNINASLQGCKALIKMYQGKDTLYLSMVDEMEKMIEKYKEE